MLSRVKDGKCISTEDRGYYDSVVGIIDSVQERMFSEESHNVRLRYSHT